MTKLGVTNLLCIALLACGSDCTSDHRTEPPPTARAQPDTTQESPVMTHRAAGPFDITLLPQADAEGVGDPAIGRMSIDKQYHCDLEAVGKGQMLGVRTAVKGSAGYVAIERVVGTLAGRAGSFVLQHSSTMDKGTPRQSITVVPDSGTDQLTGLAGNMTINIVDGKHFYEFEYRLDAAAKP